MKIILAILLAVCFTPVAGAQSNPDPGQPAMPSSAKPAMPSAAKPAMSSSAKPAQPAQTQPGHTAATSEQSAPAVSTEPASDFFRPMHVSTTLPVLDLSTGPQSDSFRPFHSTVPAQSALVMPPAPAEPARRMTLEELRKKQISELKALRESLKGSPQMEINKAVKDKKAEQSAAIEALQTANHAVVVRSQKKPAPTSK